MPYSLYRSVHCAAGNGFTLWKLLLSRSKGVSCDIEFAFISVCVIP